MKGKYDKIMAEEYDVEKIVDQVIVSHSPEVDYIDKALTYHGSLWLHKYSQYQEFFFQLGKFGNPLDYSSKKKKGEDDGGYRFRWKYLYNFLFE